MWWRVAEEIVGYLGTFSMPAFRRGAIHMEFETLGEATAEVARRCNAWATLGYTVTDRPGKPRCWNVSLGDELAADLEMYEVADPDPCPQCGYVVCRCGELYDGGGAIVR